ncbi:hypothetical protein [Inconstantimicrobium mannanitabidum]|uniref:Uncharacterized protein n=1 Tax=Inconstantimicrobium mannanitabidum TaxID=1604901 RepID=A0ACB5RI81_9CLOT|nr:hypothetical protein [Clostridium sp. TW13]GKX68783.1 hypothetical protein rsdtw13_40410 [Clostridium sp. TW13]
MDKDCLEKYGQILMSDVRDRTIRSMDMILSGRMKGITAKSILENISGFNAEQVEALKYLISKTVDLSLHNMLCMIEDNDEINVEISTGNLACNIKDISDGLAGELYTEDGWIMKYSKQRYDEL